MIEEPSAKSEIHNFADTMSRRIWLRIGWQIETRKLSYRGVAAQAGVNHYTILTNVKSARAGKVPADTKLDTLAGICKALDQPLSFFMQV